MGIVVEVIGELENFHMSREELETTRLGKHINELRRNTSDRLLASRAKSLVKKWRDLLKPGAPNTEPGVGNSGPPPGGGNNNNSSLATNGNTGSRLNNTNVALTSPRVAGAPHRGPPISPAARGPQGVNNSSLSPRMPPSAPRTPVASQLSPRMNNSQLSPRVPLTQSARSLPQVRNVPPSPAKPVPGTGTRTSPVVISSGSTSPSHTVSRPNSPPSGSNFAPVKSREASPLRSVNASPSASSKRLRGREEYEPAEKRSRVELHNGSSLPHAPSSPNNQHSDNLSSRPRKVAKRSRPAPTNSHSNLTKQMLQATRAGKVRTTQELVNNLGIESRASLSPPVSSVTDLVPNENKSELMDRFFSSQKVALSGGSEPPSRPSTADEVSSSDLTSAGPSRAPSPGRGTDSVADILAQLPPIDVAAVLAEWQSAEEEEEPELEGLLPVFKHQQEVTPQLIDELNNGQLEHIGGIRDHSGEFKEWHEMTSLESKDGELLHILPYSVID
eukprot:GFUD01117277.1.p1 GENE.GFUD01117277.1~~GFUD01117277.1.p1  ORF type:complete len:550 (-),score=106.46 GFUD01117277.1:412-1917(-)